MHQLYIEHVTKLSLSKNTSFRMPVPEVQFCNCAFDLTEHSNMMVQWYDFTTNTKSNGLIGTFLLQTVLDRLWIMATLIELWMWCRFYLMLLHVLKV